VTIVRHDAALALAALLSLRGALPLTAAPSQTVRTESGKTLRVETFVDGLEVPWSMAFTSPTRLLVTERPGRVRVVERGALASRPLAVLSDVEAKGESGLMGLALAPDYASSASSTWPTRTTRGRASVCGSPGFGTTATRCRTAP
jgi:glucose/arabinose dehydrogenase